MGAIFLFFQALPLKYAPGCLLLSRTFPPQPCGLQCCTWPCQSVVFTRMTFSGRAASDTRIWFSWSYTTFLGICRDKSVCEAVPRELESGAGWASENSRSRVFGDTRTLWRRHSITRARPKRKGGQRISRVLREHSHPQAQTTAVS